MNDPSPDKSTTVPATPRLRLSVPPKPTTPAVPSPLRNTWGVGDSSSLSSHSSPPSKQSQPTRAANFMAELIKEVTPPKKPDLSNPYQTASPVKPSLQKKPAKKRKAPEELPTEQEKTDVNLSHQTIVEATVPTVSSVLHVPYLRIELATQGSKRSRPPPNIGRTPLSKVNGISHPEPPRRSARLKSPSPPRVTANHVATNGQGNEETDIPSSKRQRVPRPTVEEVVDVDMHSPTSPINTHLADAVDSPESQPKKTTPTTNGNIASATPKPPFPLKSSAPKEPSKLRFGFAAESDPDSPPPTKPAFDHPAPAPTQPLEPLPAIQLQPPAIPSRLAPTSLEAASPPIPSSGTESQLEAKSVPKGAKDAALSLDTASLPSFSFDVPTADFSQVTSKERSTASAAGPSSLPVFSFIFGAKSAFNREEVVGMKPYEEPRPDLTNGAAVSEPAAAPSGGFNWAAAGMKMPTKAPGTWACKVCMVDNDAARVKCVSCEEPKPNLATKSSAPAVPEPFTMPVAPPSGGFNWAAAGLKVPTKAQGTWTCKVCMVDNDPTKTKCISCEEPRA